jgi:hypothetical protein
MNCSTLLCFLWLNIPTNNIVNTRSTYDIFFKTGTTGTIKTIHMTFPSSFDVSIANKLIKRSGIGSGSLSAPSSTTLIYTVSNPVSVPAGTTITMEIARIINSDTAGDFQVSIATEDTTPIIIDDPTDSYSFPVKDITGNDVSPNFMIRKTLLDDSVGNAKGWNPSGATNLFTISDSGIDITGSAKDSNFVSIMLKSTHTGCEVTTLSAGFFTIACDSAPKYIRTSLRNIQTSTTLDCSIVISIIISVSFVTGP